jgi:TPR repeat protein
VNDALGARWTTEACRGGLGDACGILLEHGVTALPVPPAQKPALYAAGCARGYAAACALAKP